MDESSVASLRTLATEIATALELNPTSWRDHLQAIRGVTASLDILDAAPDPANREWQLPLLQVFQRVAFADADNGGVPDIANWVLRQALALLQVSSDDVELLFCASSAWCPNSTDNIAVIGRNWLLRAQKSLAKIHHNEPDSSSSGASSGHPLSRSEEQRQVTRAEVEANEQLHTSDYVEARGILLPATEYLKCAVDKARTQGVLTGYLLTQVCAFSLCFHTCIDSLY